MIISFKISKHQFRRKTYHICTWLIITNEWTLTRRENVFRWNVRTPQRVRYGNASHRLVQASLRVPLLSPRISSNGFRQPRCMEIGDRSRPWVDRSYTTRCASTAPSLITNPLLIAFKWDDVPWMAAFRVVRKKEEEEVEVSTPRWSKSLLRIVDRSPP